MVRRQPEEETDVPGIRSFLRSDLTTFVIILVVLALIVVPVLLFLSGQAERKTCAAEGRTAFLAARMLAEKEAAGGSSDQQIETRLTGADGSENPPPDIVRFLGEDTRVRAVVSPTEVRDGVLIRFTCTVQGRRLYTITCAPNEEPVIR